jgi:hypothetical protein
MDVKLCRLIIKLSDRGLRIGESHGRAKLTDRDVELLRQLRDQGWSLTHLAEKFDLSRRHVLRICSHRQRATTVARLKVVTLPTVA